jgi:hypothetical protein
VPGHSNDGLANGLVAEAIRQSIDGVADLIEVAGT